MLSLLGFGQKSPFGELSRRSLEVCKSSRYIFSRKVVEMLRFMFPPQSASNINDLYYEAVDSQTSKWVKKIKQLIEIFKPNGQLGEALIVNREERTDLKSLNLGSEYEAYFGTKQAIQLLGVKKEVNALTLPIFEGFFIKLMCSVFCFKQYEKRGSWKETFENDDFHYYILRNPILHIVREWLIYTRTRPVVFNRIINVMEALLLRQPIFRFKKGEISLSIKSYHFYAIYLLIEWKTSNAVWEFLSFIVDYLEAKQKNFNVLFGCWVRIHLILLRRGSAYEMAVRRELQEGLYTLQLSKVRIQSIYQFGEHILGIQDQDYLNHLFIQVDSLLSKELWTPTPLFLTAVLTIMFMLESLDAKQRKFQSSLMSEIGKVILKVEYSLKRKEDLYSHDILQEIKGRFQNMGGNFEIDETLDETMTPDNKQRGSLFSQQNRGSKRLSNIRSSFVSYQRELSPWQRPIQGSQSHMFYGLGFMIAQGIDRLKGVKQEYPSTNLRFLASFKTIAVLVAVILIMILLFH